MHSPEVRAYWSQFNSDSEAVVTSEKKLGRKIGGGNVTAGEHSLTPKWR